MAKSTTEKAVSEFKDQAITAGYILGGQAISAQGNALVVPALLKEASATVQQIARAGIPLTAGVALTMFTKNKHLRGLAMGMGVQGIMEIIKFVMPDWTPQSGLMEGSGYTWEPDVRQHASQQQPQLPSEANSTDHVEEVETVMNDYVEV